MEKQKTRKRGPAPIKLELIDPSNGKVYFKMLSWTEPKPGTTVTYKLGKNDWWLRIKWTKQTSS